MLSPSESFARDAVSTLLAAESDDPAVRPPGFEVKPYFDAILGRAAGDIRGTIGSEIPWIKMIGDALRDALRELDAQAPAMVDNALTALRRLLARGWRQVLAKVSLLIGPHAPGVEKFAWDVIKDYVPDAEELSVGELLGKALKARESQSEAQKIADGNPGRVSRVKEACEKVNAHHDRRRKAIRLLNLALPGLLLLPGHGLQLQVTATALLLIYEVWLARDHLDSPILRDLRLPKNTDLLTAVNAAVADPH